uniref:Uncharacterized protein n=1 Tax=Knipowitschia caucasica TaxID=637954 RepID=A0AAV2ML57_KNICA
MEQETADSIVAALKLAIEEQGSTIGKSIDELKRSVDFLSAEVQDIKGTARKTEQRVDKAEEMIQQLESKVVELARYKRRWNLRLRGLQEREDEEVRRAVIEICQNVAPGYKDKFKDVIDSVHRLGRPNSTRSQPRDIIIQFSMRHYRDAIWKMSKNHDHLKQRLLRFKEDLTLEDREKRNRLWPLIQKAREEKKIAYFVGGRAFIDNKEIF